MKSRSNGGDVTIENLRPICGNCNKSIGGNDMDEFMMKHKIPQPLNWFGLIITEDIIEPEIKSKKSASKQSTKIIDEYVDEAQKDSKNSFISLEITRNIYSIKHKCKCVNTCSDECIMLKNDILFYKIVNELAELNNTGILPACGFTIDSSTGKFKINDSIWKSYIETQSKYSEIIAKYGDNIFTVFKDSNNTIHNLKSKNIYADKDSRTVFLESLVGKNTIYKGVVNKFIVNNYLDYITKNNYINFISVVLDSSIVKLEFDIDRKAKKKGNMKLYYTNYAEDIKDLNYKKKLFHDIEYDVWLFEI